MKLIKKIATFLITLSIVACSKDKTVQDFQRDQLQQKISRIDAVSGNYSGEAISKLDGTTLGAINLKFQAKTDVQTSSTDVSNSQSVTVSGSLNLHGLSSGVISFDTGTYDDQTGNFQVTIPIVQTDLSLTKLYLTGVVTGSQWIGKIEVAGAPEFGASLNLTKDAPASNVDKLEIIGLRIQQIKKTNLNYNGNYQIGSDTVQSRLGFINRDILPEQEFYKLVSPKRYIDVNLDMTDYELNFANAVIDDRAGTIDGHDPVDQKGSPARANLHCDRFESGKINFGYECRVQTKTMIIKLHLLAQ